MTGSDASVTCFCADQQDPRFGVHLYETHIPVADTKRSETFYTEVVGLPFAYRDPTRDIVFLWAPGREAGMVGLWGAKTDYGAQNGVLTECHVALAVSLEQLQRAIVKLNERGIQTFGFDEKVKTEQIIAIATSKRANSRLPLWMSSPENFPAKAVISARNSCVC